MITELILVGSGYYVATNIDIMMLKKKWKGICNSQGKFTNQNSKTLKIINIKRTEYGYIIKVELPYSYTKTDLERDMDIFKEGLKMQSMQITSKGNVVDLYCVKEYQFHDYQPINLPPNKLLIAEGLIEPIIIDMNKFPHMLIGGDTGTGKSRILLLLLANLINHSHDVELYMLQIRKNDLGVFNNCKQVKCNSKSLEDVLFALRDIDKECLRREQLIDNTKGYYNIEDYNKAHPKEKLKYTYVIIEEFSFLNT
ncbi:MAG: FtsK/SpoIIIE domain-containing protein, partial [Clostridium sp.]